MHYVKECIEYLLTFAEEQTPTNGRAKQPMMFYNRALVQQGK